MENDCCTLLVALTTSTRGGAANDSPISYTELLGKTQ